MSLIFLILISLLITTEGETNRVSLTQALWRLNRGGGGWRKRGGVLNGEGNLSYKPLGEVKGGVFEMGM